MRAALIDEALTPSGALMEAGLTANGATEALAAELDAGNALALGTGGFRGRHKAASGTFAFFGKHNFSCSNEG